MLLKFSTQQSPITLRQTPYIISHMVIYLYSIQYEFLAHFDPKTLKQSYAIFTTKCTETMIFFLFCPGKYEKYYSYTGKSFMKLLFLQNMGRTCCVHKLFWMSKSISVHNKFAPCSELGIFTYWTCNSMNNTSSYCGLVDAKIRASDKDLPVTVYCFQEKIS